MASLPDSSVGAVDALVAALDGPEATVDALDVTAPWGRAVVVDVSDRDWKAGDLLDLDDLMDVAADSGARIREGDVRAVARTTRRATWRGSTPNPRPGSAEPTGAKCPAYG